MRTLLIAALGTTMLTAACAEEADTAAAEPAATETVAAADTAMAEKDEMMKDDMMKDDGPSLTVLPAGEYAIDPGHSYIVFSYSHLGASHPILTFNEFGATVDLAADPTASALMVTINPDSIDTRVAKFDEHIKSADMFDVATYPEITFKSTSLELDTPSTGTVTGELTMKGVTKPLTLDVVLNSAGEHPFSGAPHFGITATGTLDRTEWNLGYGTPAVGAEVELRIEAEFSKAE